MDAPHIALQKEMLMKNLGSWSKGFVHQQARALGIAKQIEDLIGPANDSEKPKPSVEQIKATRAPCKGCKRQRKGERQ